MAAPAAAAQTALVVLVPEAETLVRELRDRFEPAALPGVPAHLTVLFPFLPPCEVTPAVLARAAEAIAAVRAFGFRLVRVERFATTAYLAPEPAAPFVALTTALTRAFPAFASYGGAHPAIVPHLTVAQGSEPNATHVAAELQTALREHGPVDAWCGRLSLLENPDGRWRAMHSLALPSHGAIPR
jgi:2'-5' RNA ligase